MLLPNEMEYQVIYPFQVEVKIYGDEYIIEIDNISIEPKRIYYKYDKYLYIY